VLDAIADDPTAQALRQLAAVRQPRVRDDL